MANVKVFWRTDRQTDGQKDRQKDRVITIGHPPSGGALIKMHSIFYVNVKYVLEEGNSAHIPKILSKFSYEEQYNWNIWYHAWYMMEHNAGIRTDHYWSKITAII